MKDKQPEYGSMEQYIKSLHQDRYALFPTVYSAPKLDDSGHIPYRGMQAQVSRRISTPSQYYADYYDRKMISRKSDRQQSRLNRMARNFTLPEKQSLESLTTAFNQPVIQTDAQSPSQGQYSQQPQRSNESHAHQHLQAKHQRDHQAIIEPSIQISHIDQHSKQGSTANNGANQRHQHQQQQKQQQSILIANAQKQISLLKQTQSWKRKKKNFKQKQSDPYERKTRPINTSKKYLQRPAFQVKAPGQKTVQKVIEKIVQIPVEKIVEKIINVDKIVEKVVEVPVDRIIQKIVKVHVPVDRIVQRIVNVPVHVDRPVYIDRPVIQYRLPSQLLAQGIQQEGMHQQQGMQLQSSEVDVLDTGDQMLTINKKDGYYYIGYKIQGQAEQYYTRQWCKLYRSALRELISYYQKSLSTLHYKRLFSGGQSAFIKDIYKGLSYYGLRMVTWHQGVWYPTRNGINLRPSQFKELIQSIKAMI